VFLNETENETENETVLLSQLSKRQQVVLRAIAENDRITEAQMMQMFSVSRAGGRGAGTGHGDGTGGRDTGTGHGDGTPARAVGVILGAPPTAVDFSTLLIINTIPQHCAVGITHILTPTSPKVEIITCCCHIYLAFVQI